MRSLVSKRESYNFPIKGSDSIGVLKLVANPVDINQAEARLVLVESFICEYEKYLAPSEIDDSLTSWRDGDRSVRKYYEDYFETELRDFTRGEFQYWVQATIDEKLVGWATFQREKLDQNAVYMNLLVVHPEYQGKGVGGQLVKSLDNLHEIPELSAIHLLLRRKNQGGRIFYSKLGFTSDPGYSRDDNFVNLDLLEGFTWRNPSLQNRVVISPCIDRPAFFRRTDQKDERNDTYCGFKPGFLLGERF